MSDGSTAVSPQHFFQTKNQIFPILLLCLAAGFARSENTNEATATPFQGYTLVGALNSNVTYLIDMDGNVVQRWKSDCQPALGAYLLENGRLLRPGLIAEAREQFIHGGAGGKIQEFDWDGKLVWDFTLRTERRLPHHNVLKMPNGNILAIAWDKRTIEEAIAAGRRPDAVGDRPVFGDCILEIQPTGPKSGKIVWEWSVWDHIVQDHDSQKANFGNVADHPERIDVNFSDSLLNSMQTAPRGAEQLRSLGYVSAEPKKGVGKLDEDWTHVNSLSYDAKLDQILISVHGFSEIWVIDHSTTTAEAKSSKGGRSGKGGDLLYRWGNPIAYRAGTRAEQRLFAQHCAIWIPQGCPGAGRVLLFNNGFRRPDGSYSTADELALPINSDGTYPAAAKEAMGPRYASWVFAAPDFFSPVFSGVQRLPNGNTLMCAGVSGLVLEVSPKKEEVWRFEFPAPHREKAVQDGSRQMQPNMMGRMPGGFFGEQSGLIPMMMRRTLNLNAGQNTAIAEIEKEVEEKLAQTLSEEHREKIKELANKVHVNGFVVQPRAGKIISPYQIACLPITEEQANQLHDIQKQVDEKLSSTLTAEQMKRLSELSERMGRMAGGFRPPAASGVVSTQMFHALRYAADYPGLAGKQLAPDKPIADYVRSE